MFSTSPTDGTNNTVYAFKNDVDGEEPEGGLVYVHGLIYGTTNGGDSDSGTIFQLNPLTGKEKVLHNFEGFPDGSTPGTLTYHAGAIYGTTSGRGAGGTGPAFNGTE